MQNYMNRVVVINGATGGLGNVAAQHFAASGASLALFARNEEKLESIAAACKKQTKQVIHKSLDLTVAENARKALDFTLAAYGKVDILLHFPGGWTGGKLVQDVAQKEMNEMLQQHLWSTFHTVQAFVPKLLVNGWGRIVVVSSPRAARPPAKSTAYSVAKAAQETLILAVSQELKDSGVTANILLVNTIDTLHSREEEKTTKNASWTSPEDIVWMIDHLCSDEASMINGARIPMYGSY